jgi:hypothetical protein
MDNREFALALQYVRCPKCGKRTLTVDNANNKIRCGSSWDCHWWGTFEEIEEVING